MSEAVRRRVPNLNMEDRPRVDVFAELTRVEVDGVNTIYVSLEGQGTFRLEGEQAKALAQDLLTIEAWPYPS